MIEHEPGPDFSSERHVLALDGADLSVRLFAPTAPTVATILLIHENRGMVPYMVDVAEALAGQGYRVAAPDLLSRLGGTQRFAADPTSISTRAIPSEQHISDLLVAYDWLAATGETPILFGLCFGAEMGWQLVTRRSPRAAVLYYGIGPAADEVQRIATPIYAVYAEDDPRVNATFTDLGEAMMAHGRDFLVESYPRTKHAFHDHTRPERHQPQAAAAVWERTLRYLARVTAQPG